jgi:predicted permease
MNVFLPALLLSKLGSSVDARQAVALWPLAANMVACHLVGLLLGGAQVALLGVPQELRAQTVVIPALGNVGNLPLVLVPALLASPGMQAAGVGPNGGAGDLGVAYVMFGFFVASFIQFPVGWLMLQRPEAEPAALAGSSPSLASATLAAGPSVMAAGAVGAALPGGGSTGTAASTAVGGSVAAVATPLQQQQQQLQQQQQQQQQQRLRALAKGIFTPPVIACLLAVPVASVPELRDELFRPAGARGQGCLASKACTSAALKHGGFIIHPLSYNQSTCACATIVIIPIHNAKGAAWSTRALHRSCFPLVFECRLPGVPG